MMAVVGILGTELLGVQPSWWEAGAKDYGVPMGPLTAMEFLVSSKHWQQQHTEWIDTGMDGCIDGWCLGLG
jgi:light-harvesting complex I chlorophyll a/b binding protein 5